MGEKHLYESICEVRAELEKAIEKRGEDSNINNDHILAISRKLDDLIVAYMLNTL